MFQPGLKSVAGVAGSTAGPQSASFKYARSAAVQQVYNTRHGQRASDNAAPRTSAVGSSSFSVGIDEDVEGVAVLERPGAIPSTQFEQHDHALRLCEQLTAINKQLSTAVEEADVVLEQLEWTSLTLPSDVQEKFVGVYRETRKEQHRHEKEERKQRRALREQQRAARLAAQNEPVQQPQARQPAAQPAAAAFEQPASIPQPLAQPQLSHQAPQQQPLPSNSSTTSRVAPTRQNVRTPQQQQQQQLSQQPPARVRRQRRSTAPTMAAPAAASRSAAVDVPSVEPTPVRAGTAAAATTAAARPAPAAMAAPAAEAAALPLGSTAPKAPAAPRPTATAPALGASSSSSSSSSSATTCAAVSTPSAALAVMPLQQVAPSIAPLPVLQIAPLALPQRAAPAAAAGSRRLARATSVGRRSAGASLMSAAAAPPAQSSKLADNTLHGLDMRAELLTGDQEKDLAVMVQDLLALEALAADLAVKLGRTPTDLEWMEAAQAAGSLGDTQLALSSFQARLQAGRTAKQVMIKANYKLVVSICRKYQSSGMSMGDLINEGIAGLVKGVERFEPSRGFKFSTYAHWWIRQAVSRSIAEQGRLVRLPIHMQELLSKSNKASKAFEARYGREPSAEELAAELGVEASRIQDAWEAVSAPRSLDQPMGDAEGGTLGDIVEDDRMIGSEDAVYIESLKQDLEGVLGGLSERDAGVLRMRFGLMDGKEYTLDEVGAVFKVTRERIRQIEAKAIRELRAHHMAPGSVMSDYQQGSMADKQLAARTSSGTKKQK